MNTLTISKYGPVSEPIAATEALSILEAELTEENDCSFFEMSFMGGPTPVTVRVTPDEMRRILGSL